MKEILIAALSKKADGVGVYTLGKTTYLSLRYKDVLLKINNGDGDYTLRVYKLENGNKFLKGDFILWMDAEPDCCNMCQQLVNRYFSIEMQNEICNNLAEQILKD